MLTPALQCCIMHVNRHLVAVQNFQDGMPGKMLRTGFEVPRKELVVENFAEAAAVLCDSGMKCTCDMQYQKVCVLEPFD